MPALEGGSSGRRPLCEECGRPLIACWCACVRQVDNVCGLLILQDPGEVGQAKGTAALLARCLARVEVRVGKHFEAPASTDGLLLLYPRTPDSAAPDASSALSMRTGSTPAPQTLVALDGTWRASRRLLARNSWLQALPRWPLEAPPPSRYAIRRAQRDSQRSTLEACALALAALDGDPTRYLPLWDAMDAFIALQQDLARALPAAREGAAR